MSGKDPKLKLFAVQLASDPEGHWGFEIVWDYDEAGAARQGIREFGIEREFHAIESIKVTRNLRGRKRRDFNAPDQPCRICEKRDTK